MSEIPVLAQSPISFNSLGKHLMIPLSSLYFDSQGNLKADRWPLYREYADSVDELLKRLKKQGTLRAGPKPLAKPSFTATAITPGAAVTVEIKISNVEPDTDTPANSKADFRMTETDIYANLEVAKLTDIIGMNSGGGERPGLVFISGRGTPALPNAGTYPVTARSGNPGKVDIPKKEPEVGTAFTLETRGNGADALMTSIEIKDVPVEGKFTMIVKWEKTATALAMTDIAARFAYIVTISTPPDGFLTPAAGTVNLAGGSDALSVDAVNPSATVLAQ